MSRPKAPTPPKRKTLPEFQEGFRFLQDIGRNLITGDLSFNPLLGATVELDPQITQLALQQAQGALQPAFDRARQETINRLANIGGLQSSTASNALAQADENLASQFQSIVAGAALQDRQRALSNRIGLFGTGLNTFGTGTQFAGAEQESINRFNQQRFENQIAARSLSGGSGGFFGGVLGAAGGVLGGLAAPLTGGASLGLSAGLGLLGGAAGALGPSGTGGQIFSAGSGFFGADPFSRINTSGLGRTQTLRNVATPSFNPSFGFNPNQLPFPGSF